MIKRLLILMTGLAVVFIAGILSPVAFGELVLGPIVVYIVSGKSYYKMIDDRLDGLPYTYTFIYKYIDLVNRHRNHDDV